MAQTKRLGNRLKKHKGTSTLISGKRKLHNRKIANSMQTCYGKAILGNVSNTFNEMRKTIGTNLHHCFESKGTDDEAHMYHAL